MPRAAYTLAALLLFAGAGQAQVQRLKIGGDDGLEWENNSLIFNAIEVTEDDGLSPLEADPEENILPRIKELGGSATTSVRTAAARSNQIINELIARGQKNVLEVQTKRGPGSFAMGWSPLHIASAYGIPATVRRLCSAGADPNVTNSLGWSPLHESVHRGYVHTVGISSY